MLIKHDAKKIREIKPGIICGFAGSLADCLTLIDHLEKFIDKFPKHRLLKPCIELAIKWRTDNYFKRLEASVLVADKNELIEIDGCGNVLVHDRFRSIGSGGTFAECAAEALYEMDNLDAMTIARKSMEIASLKCIYTNNNFIIKSLNDNEEHKNEQN